MALEQDILSIGFDIPRTEADKNKIIGFLNEILETSKKVQQTRIGFGDSSAGFAQFKKDNESLKQTIKDNDAVLKGYTQSLAAKTRQEILDAKAAQEAEKTRQQQLKTLKLEEEQLKKTAKAQADAAKAKQESADIPFTHNLNPNGTVIQPAVGRTSGDALNDLDKTQIQVANSATALGAANKNLATDLNTAKKSTEQLRREEELDNKIKVENKLLSQQQAAALKNQVKEENSVKGSLEQRRAALTRLKTAYDALSPVERSSGFGQRMQSIIQGVNTQVLELEKNTGRAQRNVGNYGNAITKAFSGLFGMIRQIAYVLPGIGIAGIFGLIIESVSNMVSNLLKGSDAVKKFSDEEVSARHSVAQSMGDEIGKVTFLKAALENENVTRENKKKALNDLIELQPKYFGGLKLEGDTVTGLQGAYDAYTSSILKNAKAKASLAVLQDYYKQRLDLELQATEDLTKVQSKYEDFQKKTTEAFKKGISAPVQAFSEEDRKNLKLSADIDEIDRSIRGVIKTISESDIDIDAVFGSKKAAKNTKDFNDDIIKAKAAAAKFLLQIQADLNKAIETNDQESFQARLIALKSFQQLEIDLLKVDKGNALDANKEKRDNDLKQENLTAKQKLQIRIASAIEQQNIEKKFGVDLAKLRLDQAKTLQDLEEKDALKNNSNRLQTIEERQKAEYDLQQENMKLRIAADDYFDEKLIANEQINADKKQQVAIDSYSKGKISREKYESDILHIQQTSANNQLKIQIDTLKKQIGSGKFDFDTTLKLKKKLADAELLLQQNTLNLTIKTNEQKHQDLLKLLENIKSFSIEVSGIIGGVLDASIIKQKNALQELEDQRQKSYEQEVDRIKNSTLLESDKADRLKILEAQRIAQKEENERKQRELDLKRARFEKAQNVATLIMETAIAVVRALGAKPFTPANIALAIAVGALGAAKIAVALATPIPKFARGIKNKSDDGFGIYGEEGAEYVKIPGQPGFVADKPTVGYLPRGTNIVPLNKDEVNSMMYRAMARQTAQTLQASDSVNNDLSIGYLREIANELKRNAGSNVRVYASAKANKSWEKWNLSIDKQIRGKR